MKKYRLLSILCMAMAVVCLLLLADPTEVAAATEVASGTCGADGDNLTWTLDDEGTLTISGTGAMKNWEYDCYPWGNRSLVKTLVIEEGVTTVGDYAFSGYSSIVDVTIPNSVVRIGNASFEQCSGLTSIAIPNGVTEIGHTAFRLCSSITTVSVPNSVTTIGLDAFIFCDNLEYNVFDKGEYLGNDDNPYAALVRVTSTEITEFSIHDNTKVICGYVFSNCGGLTGIMIPNGVAGIGNYTFNKCTGLTEVTLPDSLKNIGASAFNKCSGLTKVSLGNGLNTIGSYAFSDCTGLTKITIPDSVISVGEYAFYNCSQLVNVSFGKYTEEIGHNAFENCTELVSVILPQGPFSLNSGVFKECIKLKTVQNFNNSKGIADYLFYNCSSLVGVDIPGGTYIGTAAFYNCDGLESIHIPDSVRYISEEAFEDCSNLSSVDIGTGVYSIGSWAFYRCDNLKSVNITDLSAWFKISFGSWSDPFHSSTNLYLNGKLVETLVVPSGIKTINKDAFEGCASIKKLVIPEGVTTINDTAFQGCKNLSSVQIPSSLNKIGGYAFRYCDALTGVYISDLEAWYNIVFESEDANPLYYAHNLYLNDNLVTQIQIPKDLGITALKDYTFINCTSICSVDISAEITSIGNCTFKGCTNLVEVKLPDSVTKIEYHAFHGCTGLESIKLPVKLTTIGYGVFGSNTGLKKITVPFGVTLIDGSCFTNCSSLEEIVFTGPAPSIGWNAFYNTKVTAWYPQNQPTWTSSVMQQYGGKVIWKGYELPAAAQIGDKQYPSLAVALAYYESGDVMVLKNNTVEDIAINEDLYLDLAGYTLTGNITGTGTLYAMDSATDTYSATNAGGIEGTVSCNIAKYFKTDINSNAHSYMAIKTDDGYSFHRFFLGVTHMSVKPSSTGVGYKAVFYGDDMVAAALDSFGFTMQLEGNDPITVNMSGDKFVSGKVITLRIDNYDVERFGETGLSAKVMLQLTDGTVIESGAATMTFRSLMEQLNTGSDAFTADQLAAIAAMIEKHAIIKQWDTENLYK